MTKPIPVNLPFETVPTVQESSSVMSLVGPALLAAEGSNAKLAYCDYIASRILVGLSSDPDRLLRGLSGAKMDLHPTEGWFVSTKKTISVTDRNGKEYRITVEEV